MSEPYNPLAMDSIAKSIAVALLSSQPSPLDTLANSRFSGAGIYAIYYSGSFPTYDLVRKSNINKPWSQPIYVGKAIPAGGRRGTQPVGVTPATNALWDRLREHRASLMAATNLDVVDFACRWLVIEPIWIPLGESLLINRYQPLWNALLDGFGNHDPGSGRHQGRRTRWDVLHPGRAWSNNLQPRSETAQEIADDAFEYLRARLDP